MAKSLLSLTDENVYRKAKELIEDERSEIVIDFEISYTKEYRQWLEKKINDDLVKDHLIIWNHARHNFEPNQADFENYSAEWLLGFKIDDFEFFGSNVEPYREKTKEFFFSVLRPRIEKRPIKFVGQNLLFDIPILAEILSLDEKDFFNLRLNDLMLLSYALDTGQKRFNLALLAKTYLKLIEQADSVLIEADSDLIEADWKKPDEFHMTELSLRFDETLYYNRNDLRITKALYDKLKNTLIKNRQEKAIELFEWFESFYCLLSYNGVPVNLERALKAVFDKIDESLKEKLNCFQKTILLINRLLSEADKQKLLKEYRKLAQKYQKKFEKFLVIEGSKDLKLKGFYDLDEKAFQNGSLDSTFSLSTVSGADFREFISFLSIVVFDLKEYFPQTSKGSFSFDQNKVSTLTLKLNAIEDEKLQTLNSILKSLLVLNSLKANLGRVKAFAYLPTLYKTKRLHHAIRLTGTTSGRISSTKPGTMNLPKEIKYLITAETENGYIGQIDLSSAEAKLFMMYLQKESVLKELKNQGDTYSVIGKHVFGIEISKKTRPVERDVMKVAVLANMYGQSYFGLSKEIEKKYTEQYKTLDEIVLDLLDSKKKYRFLSDWDCIKFFDENRARKIKAAFEAGKIDSKQLKAELNDRELIDIDFFKLATIAKTRLDQILESENYEKFIIKNFFDFDQPEDSFVESVVKIRHRFDQSLKGLAISESESAKKAYLISSFFYFVFFVRMKSFESFNFQYKTLHALTELQKNFRISLKKNEYFPKLIEMIQNRYRNDFLLFKSRILLSEYFRNLYGIKFLKGLRDIQDLLKLIDLSDREFVENLNMILFRLADRYRFGLNFPVQGTSSYLNSRFGYELYRKCLSEADFGFKIFNTVHDANQFELYFDHSKKEEQLEQFRSIVDSVYLDTEIIRALIEDGLKSIHPKKSDFIYLPIGGELEIAKDLSETK